MSDFPAQDPEEEIFQLKKFLGFFEKRRIQLKSVYVMDERVVFIHIFMEKSVKNLFLYVSSKFNIAAEGVFKFPKYDLVTNEEETTWSAQEKIIRNFFESQLDRLEKSNIKMMWFNKKRMIYITRHNEVDAIDLASVTETGFFYMSEWEYFFKNYESLAEELAQTELGLIKQNLSYATDIDVLKVANQIASILNDRAKIEKQLKERVIRVQYILDGIKGEIPVALQEAGGKIQQDIVSQCFRISTLTSEMEQINKFL